MFQLESMLVGCVCLESICGKLCIVGIDMVGNRLTGR